MTILRVGSGGPPPGSYSTRFGGVEKVAANVERGYGEGLRWRFDILAGPHAGQVASRITGPCPTSKNACGKMLSGLTGRPLTPNEEVDVDALIGTRCLIVVAAGPEGGSRVEACVRAEQG